MSSRQNGAGLRVALASYDLRQLRVWSRYLEEQSAGIRCSVYRRGEELLAELHCGETFDVVVLGGQMEDMDAVSFLGYAGRLRQKPFFLLLADEPPGQAAASIGEGGVCYLMRQTSLKDLLEKLSDVPGDLNWQVEQCCREYYDRWQIPQPDPNCTYLTQAVCASFSSENKLAIRKEILQQVAEQQGMTIHAVNSGLRRLVDRLESSQPRGWREFKRQQHLEDEKVTTGKLIYALRSAVKQEL